MTRPRLYLVRHGETDWNVRGKLLSFTDEPLNARGEAQAAELAAALAPIRWDQAFSSPLARARRTAEVLLAANEAPPPLTVDERLREVNFGPWEGWTVEQLEADPVGRTRRAGGAALDGIEPDEAVVERARAVLATIDAGGTVLVVGHGRMLRVLISTALGLPPSFARRLRMRNCSPAILELGAEPLLLALNAADPAAEARPPEPGTARNWAGRL